MKRIKVYKNIIEVVDIVKEISNLLDTPPPNSGFNYFEINIGDVEYEDEDHIFHYCHETIIKALRALNFEQLPDCTYKYIKKGVVIAFQIDYQAGRATVQKQV